MFWDSSALGSVLLGDSRSAETAGLLRRDRELTIWWASPVECQSAIRRRHRKAPFAESEMERLLQRLQTLVEHADMVPPTNRLRQRAGHLLIPHPLSAADALQLAAALIWCEERPAGEPFVCLDERLRQAAQSEGFRVLPPE